MTFEGTLVLSGTSLGTAECSVKGEGTVAGIGGGEITKVSGGKGEKVVACVVVKGGSFGTCKSFEIEATHLPWQAELVDEPIRNEKGEVVRNEVRDRFYGSSTNLPGWVVKCGTEVLTCVGETSGNVEDVSVGVPVEFDVKSPRVGCGFAQEGALLFKGSTEGSVLSAYGAPSGPLPPAVATREASSVTSSGATLNGTVAARGVETTYRGGITNVTNTKGEPKFTCHVIKQGWCGESPIEVQATSLPWSTELIDAPIANAKGEVVRYEPRERFYGSSTSGWQLSCKSFGSVVTDTCIGEPTGNVENITVGVPVEFDSKSASLICTGSAIGTGTIEGVLLLTSEGSTLSVYGAKTGPLPPTVVTREASSVTGSGANLNGTVAAKGIETKYHFEYGKTTSYGTSLPVTGASVGSGRTRVVVGQSSTGLEPEVLYHYRLVATNSAGTSYGEDKIFTTK